MPHTSKSLLILLFAVFLLAFQPTAPTADAAPSPALQALFGVPARPLDGRHLAAPEVIAGRYVTVNLTALRPTADQPPAPRLLLNLTETRAWTAVLQRVESNPSGSYTWIGVLDGAPNSSIFLVVRGEIVVGKVAMPGAIYTVNYVGAGVHTVAQINPQKLDSGHPTDAVLPPFDYTRLTPYEQARSQAPLASDDGSLIDLMVVYTPAARAAAGGTAAMQSLLELGVAETNQAYAQSGVSQRLFLAHTAEVAYTEVDDSTDLDRLQDSSDGFMDGVHALRNTYHADFVKLVVEGAGGGLGYLQTAFNPGFESVAFSLTHRNSISPNYTFAHELGHNMGLRHDWYVDDGVTPATHAHGFTNRAGGWRTIMSYNDFCTAFGTSCTRVLYFSNPSNMYNGAPMGVASGTSSACVEGSTVPDPESCDADESAVLNTGAANNAGFRLSSTVWLGNSADWFSPANWSGGQAPRFMDDVIIPTTPAGGNFPITAGAAVARDVTIQNGATVTMSGGTLTVYGHWREQGSGTFLGTGGTVIFRSNLPQTITQNAGSAFFHVEVGDGTAKTEVAPTGNLTINGNLTVKAGAVLNGGSHTLTVGGNWTELNPSGFAADASTVILAGTAQALDKTTTVTAVNETFSGYASCCGWGGSYPPPAGWSRQTVGGSGWLLGNLDGGTAARWSNATDGWLFTHAVALATGVEYTLSYSHRAFDQGTFGVVQNQTFAAHLGTTASSGAMTTLIDTVTSNSTVAATRTATFSVPTAGLYYIGFRATAAVAEEIALLDNVVLTGFSALRFHNLTIGSQDAAVLQQPAKVLNNLLVQPDGALNLNGRAVQVEGSVTNNGALQDTLNTPAAATTHFLRIQNSAGDQTRYQGVEITPAGAMGSTTVRIRGNRDCTVNPEPVVRRCFDIAPGSPQNATIRFYYLTAEANGNPEATVNAFRWNGTAWTAAGGIPTTSSGADPRWIEVPDVVNYSPFVLASAVPNAIELLSFTAEAVADDAVHLNWQTGAEWNVAGFNVYRAAPDQPETAVNAQLIAAQGAQGQGAAYDLIDAGLTPGLYTYTLEAVDTNGVATRHGSVEALVGAPLGVTFRQGASSLPSGAAGALLLIGLLAGATAVLRRRRA